MKFVVQTISCLNPEMKLDLEQMEVSAKTVAEKSSKNKTSTSAEELHDNIKVLCVHVCVLMAR